MRLSMIHINFIILAQFSAVIISRLERKVLNPSTGKPSLVAKNLAGEVKSFPLPMESAPSIIKTTESMLVLEPNTRTAHLVKLLGRHSSGCWKGCHQHDWAPLMILANQVHTSEVVC